MGLVLYVPTEDVLRPGGLFLVLLYCCLFDYTCGLGGLPPVYFSSCVFVLSAHNFGRGRSNIPVSPPKTSFLSEQMPIPAEGLIFSRNNYRGRPYNSKCAGLS